MGNLHGVRRGFGAGQHQRKQEVVPGENEREDRGREKSGATHGEHYFPDDLPTGAAIHQCRFLQRLRDIEDVAAHHPDHIGQVKCGVQQDYAYIGIDQMQPDEQQKNREDHGDRGNHALRNDPVGQMLATGPEAGQRVGANGAEEHGNHCAHAGDHEAVPDCHRVTVLEQNRIVREMDLSRIPLRRKRVDFFRRLEGNHEQPVDGKHKDQRDGAGSCKSQDRPHSGALLHGHGFTWTVPPASMPASPQSRAG